MLVVAVILIGYAAVKSLRKSAADRRCEILFFGAFVEVRPAQSHGAKKGRV